MKIGIGALLSRPLQLAAAMSYFLVLFLSSSAPVSAAGASLYIDPGSSITRADVLGASVRLNADNNNVTFVQFGVSYDTSKLEFQSADISGSAFSRPQAYGSSGSVTVGAGSSSDRVNSDVAVINLKFRIISRIGSTALRFTSPHVYDDNYNDVASSTSGANYNFGEPAQPPPGGTGETTGSIIVTPAPPVAASTSTANSQTGTAPTTVPRSGANPSAPASSLETPQIEQLPTSMETTSVTPDVAAPYKSESKIGQGSVFLKPKQQTLAEKLSNFLPWALAALILTAILTGLIMNYARLRQYFRLFVIRHRKISFEVIPPLALMTSSSIADQVTEVPFIPVATGQADQITKSDDEDMDWWTTDINSPLMNTL